jgi:hypothetical protein
MKRMKLKAGVEMRVHDEVCRIAAESGLTYSKVVRLIVDTGLHAVSKQLEEIKK